MKIEACGLSDQGERRKKNEDAYGIFENENFYIVADGVGGNKSGDVAANETIDQLFYGIQRVLSQIDNCSEDEICKLLELNITEANHAVIGKGERYEELNGMASTFCFLFFSQNKVFYSHYGDSRIYRLRQGELKQLSHDHTLAQELIDAQKVVLNQRQKSTLTKAIGIKERSKAKIFVDKVEEQDLYCLCSDGLWDKLNLKQISHHLTGQKPMPSTLQEMIFNARKNAATDNITAILIRVVQKE